MAQTGQTSIADTGLLPFRRHIQCQVEVAISFEDVERAARVCLTQLVTDSLNSQRTGRPKTVASTRRAPRVFRVAVEPEVSSFRRHSGTVGHVHWHARHFHRLFPVMEADLVARPISGGRTRLILDATYHPPAGLLGVVGDVLFGRTVARSTADAFTRRLAETLEQAVRDQRCGTWSSSATSSELA